MTDAVSSVSKTARPRLALALQGGGAHGAYGWGVLERLLEEDVEIVAVSGASAGALNGAALVAGLATGGREGALTGLERLWKTVADGSPLRPFDHQWGGPLFEPMFRRSLEVSKMMGRYVAQLSPHLREMRALRRVVSSTINLGALTRDEALPLYIAATAVSNGAARLFRNDEITIDAIMASACLPDLFAAVTIDGEEYWDGGFSANPALEPLIFNGHGATDLLIVQITPFAVEGAPTTLGGVVGRMSDIGFNACLLRDLKALTEVQAIVRSVGSPDPAMQALAATNLHMMAAPTALAERGSASKLDTRWSKIRELRALGRATAEVWLDENAAQFRRTSTLTEEDLPDAAVAA